MTSKLKYGSIWLANLNPPHLSEPGKTRPVLIVQHQFLLDAIHPSTIIIPLTTNLIDDAEPLRLRVISQQDLAKDSDLLIDQVRAIDNKRLVQGPMAHLSDIFMGKVHQCLQDLLGITTHG